MSNLDKLQMDHDIFSLNSRTMYSHPQLSSPCPFLEAKVTNEKETCAMNFTNPQPMY